MQRGWQIMVNGFLMPQIYFSWDEATAAQEHTKANTVAANVKIINVHCDNGRLYYP